MKKVLFLMLLLFLMVLGTAGVKAQVRIGGNAAPQGAAVLDLNSDNDPTGAANKGALALPRISLASTTAQLNGTTPITGMLVYNTNATLGVGVYFWNGSNWIIISGDGVIGNELTDTIAGGGLNKTGAGTATNPYKVGIKAGGVTTGMIAAGAVTGAKIAGTPSDSGLLLRYNGTTWTPSAAVLMGETANLSLYTNRSQPVSWSLILDTVVTFDVTPGSFTLIPMPAWPTWYCVAKGVGGTLNFHASIAGLYTWYADLTVRKTISPEIVCLTPGF